MKWVEAAVIRPGRCAAIPYVGGFDDEGFIDTGSEMPGFDNHVYVSVKAVKEMARMIGLPSRADHHALTVEANRVARLLEETTRERDELKKKFEHIDVLVSEGYRVRNKPGRPTTKKPEEVAA